MKKILLSILFLSFGIAFAQKEVPAVDLKTLDGKVINTADIKNDGKPVIISFWATWCKPCQLEMDVINENYLDWSKETGVKMYSVSIDDTRNVRRVAPMVNGKAWDMNILLDTNQEFKRAMNVNTVPHTFVIVDGKIVYEHTGFTEGDEEELYQKIDELISK
jgi:thiol-disulfide isomerase/thioredoxin